jgi:hypothetical protein
MSPLLRTALLLALTACDPKNNSFFPGSDDTGPDDTDTQGDECPPVLGEVTAEQDDYPGTGWVAEVVIGFTQMDCPVEDGDLWLEWSDGESQPRTEGPWSVGYKNEPVYIQAYDPKTHMGELWLAFELPEEGAHIEFELWLEFPDGSKSNRVEGVVN